MSKLIAAINITIDGFCDHTSGIADEEIHEHYTELLKNAGTILYGRVTYQLMEYWKGLVKKPSGKKAMDDFAVAIQNIPKIVFSRTLKSVDWENTEIAQRDLKEEILAQKQQPGKDILLGSPGLIAAATKLGLIDEFQLCIHPVIAGKGMPLFKNIEENIRLKLVKTKTFGGGHVILYYTPA